MSIRREALKTYVSGIYAGLCVALAASIYLVFSSFGLRPLGAVLFCVGLIIIVIYKLSLFTGKIGYALAKDGPSPLTLLMTFLGNATAVIGAGFLLSLLRFTGWTALFDLIDGITLSRMIGSGEAWYMALFNGFFCGVLVFLAIYVYRVAKQTWIKWLGLVFFISLFVILGFEHCLANMYYFSLANAWNGSLVVNVLLVIVGNSLGGMFAYLIKFF